MAIDTAAKRMSMVNQQLPSTPMLLPLPNGSISQADRQHLVGFCNAVLFGTGGPATVLISQYKSTFAGLFARTFGRVN